MLKFFVRVWRDLFGGPRGLLLNSRDSLNDLQAAVYAMLILQRLLLGSAKRHREAANKWGQCLDLAEQCQRRDAIALAKAERQTALDVEQSALAYHNDHFISASNFSSYLRKATNDFFGNRSRLIARGINVRDVLPCDPVVISHAVSRKLDVICSVPCYSDLSDRLIRELQDAIRPAQTEGDALPC